MADTYGSLLVLRMSALGDVLFAAPLVQALASSGRVEHLAWLVEDRAVPLVEMVPEVDEIVVFPRRRKGAWFGHARALRARRDDLALDLQGNLKSRLHLGLLRAPQKWGFDVPRARDGSQHALDRKLAPQPERPHRVDANLGLLEAFGLDAPARAPRPRLAIPPESRERVQRWQHELPGSGGLLVLHPGTSEFGAFKRWPLERFARLAEALHASAGLRVVLSGGPSESALLDALEAQLDVPSVRAPVAGLHDLAALLESAALVVAADSLPLHLANALSTPVIGLYGPKDPAVTGPAYDRSRVVRAGMDCSPCTLRRCAEPICMTRLETHEVVAAAEALLAESSG